MSACAWWLYSPKEENRREDCMLLDCSWEEKRPGGLVGLPRPSRKQPQSKAKQRQPPKASSAKQRESDSLHQQLLRVTCAYQRSRIRSRSWTIRFRRFHNSNSNTYARAGHQPAGGRAPLRTINHAELSFFILATPSPSQDPTTTTTMTLLLPSSY